MDAIIAIAQSANQGMSNVLVGDLVAYTCDPLQSTMMGACNANAAITSSGSNLQLNGKAGVNKAPDAAYGLDVAGGGTNVSALSINGALWLNGANSYVVVGSQATAGATAVTFSNLSNDRYELVVPMAVPATSSGTLQLRASSNNGSTYFTTGYNSYYSTTTAAAPSTFAGSSNTQFVWLGATAAASNSVVGGTSGNYMVFNCGNSNSLRVRGQFGSFTTGAANAAYSMGNSMAACSNPVNSINAVQVSWVEGYTFAPHSQPVTLYTLK